MFRWALAITLALSVGFCAWRELEARQRLEQVRNDIARYQTELLMKKSIDDEVQTYIKQKSALQKRIDLINKQKRNQQGAAGAIEKLAAVDSRNIESVAVVHNDLVINRR